jgi:hypothetical protein
MQGNSYRLKTQTLGSIISEGDPRKPVIIPRGAVVKVISDPVDHKRFVDVTWEDKTVMMFTQDIRQRAAKVKGSKVAVEHGERLPSFIDALPPG